MTRETSLSNRNSSSFFLRLPLLLLLLNTVVFAQDVVVIETIDKPILKFVNNEIGAVIYTKPNQNVTINYYLPDVKLKEIFDRMDEKNDSLSDVMNDKFIGIEEKVNLLLDQAHQKKSKLDSLDVIAINNIRNSLDIIQKLPAEPVKYDSSETQGYKIEEIRKLNSSIVLSRDFGSDGYKLERDRNRFYFINQSGKQVTGYDFIEGTQNFSNGIAFVVNVAGERYFINTKFKRIIEVPDGVTPRPFGEHACVLDGYHKLKDRRKGVSGSYVINRRGRVILDDLSIEEFNEFGHARIFSKRHQYGLIDKKGKVLLKRMYRPVKITGRYYECRVKWNSDISVNNHAGLALFDPKDLNKDLLKAHQGSIAQLGIESEGLIPIRKDHSIIGRWTFLNLATGEIISNYSYRYINSFENGLAIVTKFSAKTGFIYSYVIDKTGLEIISFANRFDRISRVEDGFLCMRRNAENDNDRQEFIFNNKGLCISDCEDL